MSGQFTIGERVLCYHGILIYEAKILKSATFEETSVTQPGLHYLVHYKGWKQKWDEWVSPTRLLKYNEANITLQKGLQAQRLNPQGASTASTTKQGKAQASSGAASGSRGVRKDGARGTKRGREEDEGSKKPEMKLDVPEILKAVLIDDWEAITKHAQLVSLPRSPNVVELLQGFKDHITSAPLPHLKEHELVLPTVISGLQVYFDRSLGANLLYRFERPQYAEIRKKYVTGPTVVVGQEKEMSAIYGAEHLLRMLVTLPAMVGHSSMDAESVGYVRDYTNELLLYMLKERPRIFLPEYEGSTSQYQNISRS